MKKCFVIVILGIVFITSIILILRSNITTVYCTKCEEDWIVVGSISDEEEKCYVCPDCRRINESDTDDSDTDDSDTDDSGIYTNPVKGMLHRHMGGTGGLW